MRKIYNRNGNEVRATLPWWAEAVPPSTPSGGAVLSPIRRFHYIVLGSYQGYVRSEAVSVEQTMHEAISDSYNKARLSR